MVQFRLAMIVLLVAEFSNVQHVVEGVQEFKRCYNTSEEEMHCFDAQFDTATNQPFLTSFQNAQTRCKDVNSTLVTIKNEEIGNLIQRFMNEVSNPIGNQYFWLNAYQVSYYDNPDRWHWLNSALPNIPGSAVSFTYDSNWYAAVLEFRTDSGGSQFYLTPKQPQSNFFYVCEYSVSNCSSANSNDIRLMNGRCYRVVQELATWYNARNKCLKDGGDLASFANVTSINFTSWLISDTNVKYWIGLRFLWYTWGDAGQDLKYTNWATMNDLARSCVIFCFNCDPPFSWTSKDCTDSLYVVCHKITPLAATTTSVVKTSTSAGIAMSTTTMLTTSIQQFGPSSSKAAECICSSQGSLGAGLGVGLGVPLAMFIILAVFFAVKSKRLETLLEQKTRNDRTELGAVQAQSTEQINDSVNDNNYQQLNRNLDNSSGTMMYDKLRVAPEAQYEEFPPS